MQTRSTNAVQIIYTPGLSQREQAKGKYIASEVIIQCSIQNILLVCIKILYVIWREWAPHIYFLLGYSALAPSSVLPPLTPTAMLSSKERGRAFKMQWISAISYGFAMLQHLSFSIQ